MKRGPPVRNGGPPPKRSAPSGPMSRRTCEDILSFSTRLNLNVQGSFDSLKTYCLVLFLRLDWLLVTWGCTVNDKPICVF